MRVGYIQSVTVQTQALPWLEPGQDFPPIGESWGTDSPAPGLLAAGGALDSTTLRKAYRQGIFPWFGKDEPLLWWSPDPRMVLEISNFKLHSSLQKTIRKFRTLPECEIRFDTSFEQVIRACANSPRHGQKGSWIVPEMINAYCSLHHAGYAHSVETWIKGELAGGLYCVALGKSVFGESMFSNSTDASKIALAALVAFCRAHGIVQIDCQQNTQHLASLGAKPMPRQQFLNQMQTSLEQVPPVWSFDMAYWESLFN